MAGLYTSHDPLGCTSGGVSPTNCPPQSLHPTGGLLGPGRSSKEGKSYSFEIGLCTSEKYLSATRASALEGGAKYNYVTPAKLMIWGGNSLCDKAIPLGESPLISNNSWQKYNFTFKPTRNVSYITLEAFYRTPVLEPYNGNLLVDNASPITEIIPKAKR